MSYPYPYQPPAPAAPMVDPMWAQFAAAAAQPAPAEPWAGVPAPEVPTGTAAYDAAVQAAQAAGAASQAEWTARQSAAGAQLAAANVSRGVHLLATFGALVLIAGVGYGGYLLTRALGGHDHPAPEAGPVTDG